MRFAYRVVLLCHVLTLFGCASFREVHYFKTVDSSSRAVNYFRLTVKGNAGFSSARYLASCFDERAVDLFFNELKTPENTVRPIFKVDSGQDPPSEIELDSCKSPGKFVMIMSTNPDSVANTIGSFAESNVSAAAMTNLLNRDAIATARLEKAGADATTKRLTATREELTAQIQGIPSDDGAGGPPDQAVVTDAFLRVVNTVGRELGAPPFQNLTDARAWLSRNRSAFAGDN